MTRVGIYIHFPFCKIKCMYCDFYSIPDREDDIFPFIDALVTEINIRSEEKSPDWIFDTLFIGGGTPSLIQPSHLEKVLNELDRHLDLSHLTEITMEANPGEAPAHKLRAFRELGVNRLSMGFQSFDPELLKFMGRIHSPEDCIRTFDSARDSGFENISADLIFGIPGQSMERWMQDLKRLTDLRPKHISAYSLTVEKGTQLSTLVKAGEVTMPAETLDIEMFKYTREYLSSCGYQPYEISNFASVGKECRHNLHYWHLDPYLAFGPAAHGYDGERRWWNVRSIDEYMHRLQNGKLPSDHSEILSHRDYFNELIFNGLRLAKGVPLSRLEAYFSGDLNNYLSLYLGKWKSLKREGDRLFLTPEGVLLADEIASDLFIDGDF